MADNSVLLDIDKVLAEKAKGKYVPGFIRNYLKRIVHQEELNDFLRVHGEEVGLPFIESCLKFIDVNVEVKGAENLPEGGPFTFVSNHPLGGPDGLALGMVLGKHYDGKIKYLVNDILMNVKGLAPFFVPINKTGKQSRDFPRQVEACFQSDNHVIMFPAGICSRKQHGVIKDLDWKKTFISKSVEYHRDVVPMHFDGRNSDFFYRLANWSKALGIKFNIAMLYLVDEMMKNRHKTFTITIGKPIPWQTFDKSRNSTEWAQYVKDIVYLLNTNND